MKNAYDNVHNVFFPRIPVNMIFLVFYIPLIVSTDLLLEALLDNHINADPRPCIRPQIDTWTIAEHHDRGGSGAAHRILQNSAAESSAWEGRAASNESEKRRESLLCTCLRKKDETG